ncbi:hypothetical protein MMC19_001917 [Ptychographa xylographoides]|nr:hypothetical protein [Ptychographa xylographoides]
MPSLLDRLKDRIQDGVDEYEERMQAGRKKAAATASKKAEAGEGSKKLQKKKKDSDGKEKVGQKNAATSENIMDGVEEENVTAKGKGKGKEREKEKRGKAGGSGKKRVHRRVHRDGTVTTRRVAKEDEPDTEEPETETEV